jgi:hypothetical protein
MAQNAPGADSRSSSPPPSSVFPPASTLRSRLRYWDTHPVGSITGLDNNRERRALHYSKIRDSIIYSWAYGDWGNRDSPDRQRIRDAWRGVPVTDRRLVYYTCLWQFLGMARYVGADNHRRLHLVLSILDDLQRLTRGPETFSYILDAAVRLRYRDATAGILPYSLDTDLLFWDNFHNLVIHIYRWSEPRSTAWWDVMPKMAFIIFQDHMDIVSANAGVMNCRRPFQVFARWMSGPPAVISDLYEDDTFDWAKAFGNLIILTAFYRWCEANPQDTNNGTDAWLGMLAINKMAIASGCNPSKLWKFVDPDAARDVKRARREHEEAGEELTIGRMWGMLTVRENHQHRRFWYWEPTDD